MESSSHILVVDKVSKSYEDHLVLDQIELTVAPGQVVGLLGPNGAGKSTLIRIINRILSCDSGEILFDGQSMNDNHLDRIGYLPEERGLYRQMNIEEHGVYFGMLKGLSKHQAVENLTQWMDKLGVAHWKSKKVQDLSKGMSQKFQFIASILHEPELIILDEPFSGFDPVNREVMLEIILDLKKQGKGILLSTHDMASVESLCDQIYLLDQSKFLIQGSPQEVRKISSQQVYEIGFVGSDIAFANALWTAFELISIEAKEGYSIALVRPTAHQPINTLLNAILPTLEIKFVSEKTPTIGDVYIDLIAKIEENSPGQNNRSATQ